ncbi:hypothetical protein GOV12_07175 [Candidatus Pacearchaeota archaeon]|nr:hypothetical protein [Candidatus Pacearchaeota archaeon]
MTTNSNDWFNKKYSDGSKPTQQDRIHLLMHESVQYSDRQLRGFRDSIRQGLHDLRAECTPAKIVRLYAHITALNLSNQVMEEEIVGYSRQLEIFIRQRCSEFSTNFG